MSVLGDEGAQDVFRTVVRRADRFHGDSAPSSWIYRVCVNACLMQLRKSPWTETVPFEEILPACTEESAHARPVEDWSPEIKRRVPGKEIGRVVGEFSEELPEKYRMVFAL